MSYLTREQIEQREKQMLAGYASLAAESRGRLYPQPEHEIRTAYQRDRDRIIHCSAFRRLEYKTQVFIPHEKDHFRTRLTHTIEVAQISRTIARSLRLNEDLTEAIALVHDVGHTPFGHAGEDILDKLLRHRGGFNHNRQSLRVVDVLEQRYPEHPGLNLTYEVREGIIKHETKSDIVDEEFSPELQPSLEAALVDLADSIAYNSHDIDDGLSSGLITFEMLRNSPFGEASSEFDEIKLIDDGDEARYGLVRQLINIMGADLIEETARRLAEDVITNLEQVRRAPSKLLGYSPSVMRLIVSLKQFLNDNLYKHERLVAMSEWAAMIITKLFDTIVSQPSIMPPRFVARLEGEPPDLVVADYIAGMTDRFAIKLYEEVG